MATDYWANRFADDPRLLDDMEDPDFDLEAVVQSMADDDWEEVK